MNIFGKCQQKDANRFQAHSRNILLQFVPSSQTNLGCSKKPHFWTKSLKSRKCSGAASGCGPHRNVEIHPQTDAKFQPHVRTCFPAVALSTEHQQPALGRAGLATAAKVQRNQKQNHLGSDFETPRT